MKKSRLLGAAHVCVFGLITLLATSAPADTITVQGTVYTPNGIPARGGHMMIDLSQTELTDDGATSTRVVARTTATIDVNGTVSFKLTPNDAITPSGTFYTVRFSGPNPDWGTWVEYWQIDSFTDPIDISSIKRLNVPHNAMVGEPVDFAANEPSGSCDANESPRYVIDTDEQCNCGSGMWYCSFSANGIQSLATLYTIINDGVSYKAIDSSGATAYSSTDFGSVLQYTIDDAQITGGRIVLRDGDTFTYTSTIPKFRPNSTKWVSIVGYGATIELAATAYRVFDFDKQTDFDVFGRIHLEGFTVDANLVNTSNANHVLLGFTKDNHRARDVSIDGIIVKNVRVLDVFADNSGADHAMVVNLTPFCSRGAAQEPYLRNIWVSGMEIRGGEGGILVAVGDLGTKGAYRCFIENVYILDNSVSLGEGSGDEPPAEFYNSTGIHVGGNVRYTRNVHISGNYVQHAGDNCYEINAPLEGVTFDNNTCLDPTHVGLTLNNFPSVGDPDGDGNFGEENLDALGLTVSNFSVQYTTYPSGTKPQHCGITVNNWLNTDSPFGDLRVSNFSYVDISGDYKSNALYATNKWTHITVDGMQINHSDIEYDEVKNPTINPTTASDVVFYNTRAGGSFTLRNIKARYDGEYDANIKSGGHNIYSRLFLFSGADLDIDVENVHVEVDLRNLDNPNDKYAVFEIGQYGTKTPPGHATVSGKIANVEVIDETSFPDDNPYLFRFGSRLVIDDDLFFVDNVDARSMTDSANLIFFDDSALKLAGRVFVSGLRRGSDAILNTITTQQVTIKINRRKRKMKEEETISSCFRYRDF